METLKTLKFLIAVCMMAHGTQAHSAYNVTAMPPAAVFVRMGDVLPGTDIYHLVIDVDVATVDAKIRELHAIATNESFIGHTWWSNKASELAQQAHEVAGLFLSAADRSKRSFWTWLEGLLGIRNTFAISHEAHRTDVVIGAAEKTIHMVDAIAHHMNETDNAVLNVIDDMKDLHHQGDDVALSQLFDSHWQRLCRFVDSLAMVARSAMQGKLDPAILSIHKLDTVWQDFKAKLRIEGKSPAFEHFQHLFVLPVSYAANMTHIRLVVHIPIVEDEAVKWALYKPRSLPLVHNDRLYWLPEAIGAIAVHSRSKRHMILRRTDMEQAITIGTTTFLRTGAVSAMEEDGACLAALWYQRFAEAASICGAYSRPIYTAAWPLNATTFLTAVAPSDAPLRATVRCGGKIEADPFLQGYQLVSVGERCRLSTSHFELIPTFETGKELIVRAGVFEPTEHYSGNRHRLRTANESLSGSRMDLQTEEVLTELEAVKETGTSTTVWIAIGIAMTVVIGVLVFIGWLYLRARKIGLRRAADEAIEMGERASEAAKEELDG